MRFRRALVVGALICALVVIFGACSSSSKKSSSTTTTQAGASVKNFSVSIPEGQVSLSLTGSLPPGWPASFPIPAGATPAGSGSLGNSSTTEMIAVYSTAQAPDQAFAFYSGNSSLQPSDSKSFGSNSAFVGTMKISGSYSGSVSVVGHSGTTYIVILLSGTSSSSTSTGSEPTTSTTGGSTTSSSS